MTNDCTEFDAFDLGVSVEDNNTITLVMVSEGAAVYYNVKPDRALQLANLIIDATHEVTAKRRTEWVETRARYSAIRLISEAVNAYNVGDKFTASEIASVLGLNPGVVGSILKNRIRGCVSVGYIKHNRRPVNLFERVEI